jgi:cobalamin synthase
MSLELESWRKACTVLVVVSLILGLIQRTSYRFLDPTFEVSIFHVTTILSLVIYYSLTRRQGRQDAT